MKNSATVAAEGVAAEAAATAVPKTAKIAPATKTATPPPKAKLVAAAKTATPPANTEASAVVPKATKIATATKTATPPVKTDAEVSAAVPKAKPVSAAKTATPPALETAKAVKRKISGECKEDPEQKRPAIDTPAENIEQPVASTLTPSNSVVLRRFLELFDRAPRARKVQLMQAALDVLLIKLVIHTDFNNTVMTKESTSGHSATLGLFNELLGKTYFGIMQKDAEGRIVCWRPYSDNPMVRRGGPLEICWYELQRLLMPNDEALKAKAATFLETDGKPMAHHLAALEAQGEKFFESFLEELRAFPDATIVGRSFGEDIQFVLDGLKAAGLLKDGMPLSQCTSLPEVDMIKAVEAIYSMDGFADELLAQPGRRFLTVQQNYTYWRSRGKKAIDGKRITGALWAKVNKGGFRGLFQVGLDDLDCMYGEGPLVFVHRIDTLRALRERDYFVDFILADFRAAFESGALPFDADSEKKLSLCG